jgi:hypothetical protein
MLRMSATTYIGVVREGKIELAGALPWPEGSQVSITVSMLIPEQTARRKANRWLVEQVGNMVMAGEAELVRRETETIWRFGAMVTASSHPPLGPIGHVEVHAGTGEILSDEQIAEMMIERGQHFTGTSASARNEFPA